MTLAAAGALAQTPDVVIDDTMSGGYFSGGIAGKGYVQVTRVHPNPNTGCVSLRLRLLGWKMYPAEIGLPTNRPDGGHYHIYVDGRYYTAAANPVAARACGLATGVTHTLRVVLANNNHRELRARSQIVSVVLS
jgi:hypothetical protein